LKTAIGCSWRVITSVGAHHRSHDRVLRIAAHIDRERFRAVEVEPNNSEAVVTLTAPDYGSGGQPVRPESASVINTECANFQSSSVAMIAPSKLGKGE
jgi:hypothetical protein